MCVRGVQPAVPFSRGFSPLRIFFFPQFSLGCFACPRLVFRCAMFFLQLSFYFTPVKPVPPLPFFAPFFDLFRMWILTFLPHPFPPTSS